MGTERVTKGPSRVIEPLESLREIQEKKFSMDKKRNAGTWYKSKQSG